MPNHAIIMVLLATGCGTDPVSYSAPVGINLKAKSANTSNGTVTDEKSINTETGNPYGAFVDDARAKIGRDPGVIDVDRVEVLLGAGSSGVVTLGEIFDGTVEVVFQMNTSQNSYQVASGVIGAATDSGPAVLAPAFQAAGVPDVDYTAMLTGSFKTVLRGPAAPGFVGKGADADLQVTFTFAAFE